MKIVAYIICGVVAILTVMAIISAVSFLMELVMYGIVIGFFVWLAVVIANFFMKEKDKQPPS